MPPGLLFFETEEGEEIFLAVDEGILVKCGEEVRVSTRDAVQAPDLGEVRKTVEEEFRNLDEREKKPALPLPRSKPVLSGGIWSFSSMAKNDKKPRDRLIEQVEAKESRKVKAREEGEKSAWFGLGMFGLVGWSVAIPTLIGIAVGIWLDSTTSDQYSWTLMGIFVGIILGCVNAWSWVKRESRHD